MAKKQFYELTAYVPDHEIASEISEKLDAIGDVAGRVESMERRKS